MQRLPPNLIFVGVVVLIAVLIGGGTAVKEEVESYWRANDITAIAADQEASVFDAKIANYAAQKWDTEKPSSPGTKPNIKKIVIVDVSTKKKDDLNSSLPEDMRASSPQEVDAVVLTRRGEERVGSYSSGAGAFRKTISISVFLPNGETLCTKAYQGSDPPASKTGRGSGYGTEPNVEAAVTFIMSCIRNVK